MVLRETGATVAKSLLPMNVVIGDVSCVPYDPGEPDSACFDWPRKANQLASSKTLAKPNLRLIALWPLSRRGDALKTSSAREKDFRSSQAWPSSRGV